MHVHVELVLPLKKLSDEAEFQRRIEEVVPDVEWVVGGRFRGMHEPGGPYPHDGIERVEVGGLPLVFTAGRSGIDRIGFFVLARPLDVVWLDSAEAMRFLREGPEPRRWVRLLDGDLEDITRQECLALASAGPSGHEHLALATLDVHE